MMIVPAASSAHAPLPEGSPGLGPTGPPTGGAEFVYAGNKIGLQWTNGDPLAFTEIGQSESEPTVALYQVGPGETTYETGTTTSNEWWVRHLRNGQRSAWAKIFPEGE